MTNSAKLKYEQLGLTLSEYDSILTILEREPTDVELAVYSLMWSEHCGYKHSRSILKQLPTKAAHVLLGPGENAGVIDIGEDFAVALKIESHNHPSAVEPFQGAATGVGGIVRDIFAMGARPIASLNSLRFGDPKKPRQKYLLDGVVSGIGHYGNCLGVPTVGGEVYFEDSYEGNCLVNAMAVGLVPKTRLIKAAASGPGNLVVLIGSKTGRDGIGGASVLASQEFDETLHEKRPSVQVGDPFTEKLLIEACLELLEKNLFIALGDLGAAGITSSASEMAARGGVGIDLDVSAVPLRETGMAPYEIMISESQERMLAVVAPGRFDDVRDICAKWELPATIVGKITEGNLMRIYNGEDLVGSVPVSSLTDDAPSYEVEAAEPAYLRETRAFNASTLDCPVDTSALLIELLGSANICSRSWIWRQYDHQVQTNTVVLPGGDAAVLRLKGTNKGLALTVDCNGRYCYLDPYHGARVAVAEAARNLACVGARPLAVTDCLNFGNPEKAEISWQFKEAVRGIADACRAFDIPVISGNVSFYNESFGEAIYPTPTIGMVGLLDDVTKHCGMAFKDEGDLIILIGDKGSELGGSEYLKVIHKKTAGMPPMVDFDKERLTADVCRRSVVAGLLSSAHDCSEGGIAVCLAESAIVGDIGAIVDLGTTDYDPLETAGALFGEDQSRIVVTLSNDNLEEFGRIAAANGVNYHVIGKVGGDIMIIDDKIRLSLPEMKRPWQEALKNLAD